MPVSTVSFSSFSVRNEFRGENGTDADVHLWKSSKEVGAFCGLTAGAAALAVSLPPCWPADATCVSMAGLHLLEQKAGFAELVTNRQQSLVQAAVHFCMHEVPARRAVSHW